MLGSGLHRALFSDTVVRDAFAMDRQLAHFLAFEIALTAAQIDAGQVDPTAGAKAIAEMRDFRPDIVAIDAGALRDGLPVPAFVAQLKAQAGAVGVHQFTTSQDLMDTGVAMALRDINQEFGERLGAIIVALDGLATQFGAVPMMARTRMQAALPITVADRLGLWRDPLTSHVAALPAQRAAVEVLHLGGPVGDARNLPDNVAAHMATGLGLAQIPVQHTARAGLVSYANWLALVTGSLGKMGQDLALMAQQGIDEAAFSAAGSSSAMPHKQNPILAEILVTLARYNATQISGLHHAMVHEQERSGAAWSLEWLILPAMAEATGTALIHAETLLNTVTRLGADAGNMAT